MRKFLVLLLCLASAGCARHEKPRPKLVERVLYDNTPDEKFPDATKIHWLGKLR